MLVTTDRTNFPIVIVEEAAVEVQLLPVTKLQFEDFVTAPTLVNQERYDEMLALNPAVSPEAFSNDNRERLFVSGILPEEAIAFARWLGHGFDLPTVQEWRAILAALRRVPEPRHNLLTDLVEGEAGVILRKLTEQLHIRTLADYTLMRGGLVEWVRQDKDLVGLGVPRPEFHPNLWDPLTNVVRPIQLNERVPYFGLRLVRRGDWYLSDKENASYVF